jgi:hypothetical protein
MAVFVNYYKANTVKFRNTPLPATPEEGFPMSWPQSQSHLWSIKNYYPDLNKKFLGLLNVFCHPSVHLLWFGCGLFPQVSCSGSWVPHVSVEVRPSGS